MTYKQIEKARREGKLHEVLRGMPDPEFISTCKNVIKKKGGSIEYRFGSNEQKRYLKLTQKPLSVDVDVSKAMGFNMANFKLGQVGWHVIIKFKDGWYRFKTMTRKPSDDDVKRMCLNDFPTIRKFNITRG